MVDIDICNAADGLTFQTANRKVKHRIGKGETRKKERKKERKKKKEREREREREARSRFWAETVVERVG